MSRDDRQMLRPEWTRPCKTENFQARKDNSCSRVKRVKPSDVLYEKVRSCRTTRSSKLAVEADSIDNDAYVIAMSYPEGRQKLLDRAILDSAKSCHSTQLEANSIQSAYIDGTMMNETLMDTADGTKESEQKSRQKDKIHGEVSDISMVTRALSDDSFNNIDDVEMECDRRDCNNAYETTGLNNSFSVDIATNQPTLKQTALPLNEDFDAGQHACDIVPDGSLLWGKMGKQWWPAIKITGPMAGQPVAGNSHLWLLWFSDFRISRVKHWHAVSFGHHFKQHYKRRQASAVLEALKVCLDRCGLQIDGDENILEWGQVSTGLDSYLCDSEVDPFLPVRGCEFPAAVMDRLQELRADNQVVESDCDGDSRERLMFANQGTVDKCININLPGFCVCCAKQGQNIVDQHPMFEGSVCPLCKDNILEGHFVIDDDGYYMYCCVCGDGGGFLSAICEEVDCGRSFCALCLNRYLSNNSLLQIENTSAWTCLLCSVYKEDTHGVLVPRSDWKDRIVTFYNPKSSLIPFQADQRTTGRRLRVLSLHDGIGAVKVALEELGLDVRKYIIAESDGNARKVTDFHNMADKCVHDVAGITREWLEKLGRINLVVASLSCEKVDTVNHDGLLYEVSKVVSIIKHFKAICEQRDNHFYWIIEAPIHMKSHLRNMITDCLQVEHYSMWDAQFVSPYICPKLYWGTIPGINSAVQCYSKNKDGQEMLGKYLTPIPDRKAKSNILRSVAVDFDNGKTKGGNDFCLKPLFNFGVESVNRELMKQKDNTADVSIYKSPVLMNNKRSAIWATEVERVLGFPPHYSDCPEVSIHQRQKLLKRTTSVKLLKEILKPLTQMFFKKRISLLSTDPS